MAEFNTFSWNPKQWLGDDKVIAMEWDARGMHFHLLNIAWQQDPPCSIPDDMDAVRRWLMLPPDASLCNQRGSERGSERVSERDSASMAGRVSERVSGYVSGYVCRCNDCIWRRVRPQIFAAWSLSDGRWYQPGLVRSWEKLCRRSEAGTNNVRKRYQTSTNPHCIKEVDFDSSKSKSIKPSTKSKIFVIPVLTEIQEYCAAESLRIDPQQFMDHYTANGWKVGRSAMKDWHAAVRNWARNNFHGGGNGKLSFEERAAQEREIARQYSARTSR